MNDTLTHAAQLAFIEPICAVILSLWLVLRFRAERERRALAIELAVIAVAAWIGEMSCVRLYGFYAYGASWRVMIDVVPLAVVCIWPVVIKSALDLLAPVMRSPLWRAGAVAGLVVVDAALIEPISVGATLWWWSEPGPFLVPVIGVIGWGFFAFGCALCVREGRVRWPALVIAPLVTHGMLLAAWWGAFKWLPHMDWGRQAQWTWVALAWIGAVGAAAWLWRARPAVTRADVWRRAPAAAFFFALLLWFSREQTALVAFAIAFAPPWLVLGFAPWLRRPSSKQTRPPSSASSAG